MGSEEKEGAVTQKVDRIEVMKSLGGLVCDNRKCFAKD